MYLKTMLVPDPFALVLSILQLNLRHRIDGSLMMYPGYGPQLGINYRVFHYGLDFKVGNWRFDKGNWKNTDLVRTCWAKFPDPPDPITLDRTDEDAYNRDLLSIECARTLNEALYLHHKRRNCPDPNILVTLDEVGNKETIHRNEYNANESSDSSELQNSPQSDELNFFGILVALLGVVLFLGVLLLIVRAFVGDKKRKRKGT